MLTTVSTNPPSAPGMPVILNTTSTQTPPMLHPVLSGPIPLPRLKELDHTHVPFPPTGCLPVPSIKEIDPPPKQFGFHRERKRRAESGAVDD